MRVVKQEVKEVLEVPSSREETLKHIEKVGRICYQSEDKITADSAEPFCKKLVKSGHMAMIEMSWTVLKLDVEHEDELCMIPKFMKAEYNSEDGSYFIAGNWRAWIETLKEFSPLTEMEIFEAMPQYIVDVYDGFGFCVELVEGDDIPENMRAYTAILKTDRAVTHELVRHRPASFAQESQRYCAYRKNVEFIEPYFLQDDFGSHKWDAQYSLWERSCFEAEKAYKQLLNKEDVLMGVTPQAARAVLPNCVATEIAVTADIAEWNHIFSLRTAKDAYPPIRSLMLNVKDKIEKLQKG